MSSVKVPAQQRRDIVRVIERALWSAWDGALRRSSGVAALMGAGPNRSWLDGAPSRDTAQDVLGKARP